MLAQGRHQDNIRQTVASQLRSFLKSMGDQQIQRRLQRAMPSTTQMHNRGNHTRAVQQQFSDDQLRGLRIAQSEAPLGPSITKSPRVSSKESSPPV